MQLSRRIMSRIARVHAHSQYQKMLRDAQSATRVQASVLRDVCSSLHGGDLAKALGLSAKMTPEQFAESVPPGTYESHQPFIERVMTGETSAMFPRSERVLMFATTSGTTARAKYVPSTRRFLREYRRGWNAYGIKALLDHPSGFVRKILQITSPIDDDHTPGGVPIGSISGLLAQTQKKLVQKFYVAPRLVSRIADPEARYYAIGRLSVCEDVAWIITANPATHVKLARSVDAHAERVIRDVRDGTITPPGEISVSIRAALSAGLAPNREAAKRLEAMRNRRGALLPRDYWNLALISCWTGGTMGLHLSAFEQLFGHAPVRDIGLLATEGRISIPIEDATAAGVLDVRGMYYEFIEPDDTDGSTAIPACDVEVGREYRVLLTNFAGLVRYDIGDHVRVTGFLGEAPIVEFLHRGAHVSSVTGEKLTEWQVTAAFRRARADANIDAERFVLAPAFGETPHYKLYLEGTRERQEKVGTALDAALSQLNMEYESKRRSNRLGPVETVHLPPGALIAREHRLQADRRTTGEQYKHKYLLTVPGEDEDLQSAASAGVPAPDSADSSTAHG